ncbi:MAG: hypothetical protein HUU47_05875 [Bacteroidetes bacterium]|nr:hypothetical protein [Bacteroidota bacterium]
MKKTATLISYIFHPLFVSFFNILFLLISIGNRGPVLGFTLLLSLFFLVLIPVFYTVLIIFLEKRNFKLSYLSEAGIDERTKILAVSIIHFLIFLILTTNLNFVFLRDYKTMFSTIIMGMVLISIVSFLFHFFGVKNSLHTLVLSFFACFYLIFIWQVPDLNSLATFNKSLLLNAAATNLLILIPVSFSRYFLKSHDWLEIAFGIFIGIFCPIVLTLLSYGL